MFDSTTLRLDDTIAAVASPSGSAARGVVRLSGDNVVPCLHGHFFPDQPFGWESISRATAIVGELRLPGLAAALPATLYFWPNHRSYTQQPTAEVHTLGSPPLLELLLAQLCAAGARVAEPGEFTLRAFLAGRLDLTQAEAVLGAIDATDRRQFDVALAQLAGGLSGPLQKLRDQLLDSLAHLEAGLDFVEEDIEFIGRQQLVEQLDAAAAEVTRLVEQVGSRGDARQEACVVLCGWPNVGKSSLFNALIGRSRAIVSSQEGTTRDYLTATLDCQGQTCQLIDTAGADPSAMPDTIAHAAETNRTDQQTVAHVEVLCLDATRPPNAWEQQQLGTPAEAPRIVVLTKADQPAGVPLTFGGALIGDALATSSHSGTGIDELRQRIGGILSQDDAAGLVTVASTASRCRDSLREAADSLSHASRLATGAAGEELVAAELRAALEQLGRVVGAVYTDDVLDRIFSRFCIGK